MKRAISLLLSILMVLSLCPVSALADDGSGVEPDTTGQVETIQPEAQTGTVEVPEEGTPSDADASGEDDGDADDELFSACPSLQQEAGDIVDHDRREKQRHILQLPESIKNDAGDGQEQIFDFERRNKPVEDKHRRQKHEYEDRRAENQTIFPLPPWMSKNSLTKLL